MLIGAILIALTVFLRLHTTHALPGSDLPGNTQLRLDAFMFPCILAIALRDGRLAPRFREMLTPWAWWALIVALAAGIAVAAFAPIWREPQRLCQSALLPVIIATAVMRPDDWPGRLLRHPATEWLGRISYSVYLWQQLVFGFAPRSWPARGLALTFLLLAILLIAAISRKWIELPLIRLGHRIAEWSEHRLAQRNHARIHLGEVV